MRQLNLTSKKIEEKGFPGVITDKGRKFYLMEGSLQYFGGDVKRITRELKKKGIKYRVVTVMNPEGMGNYLIYVNDRTTVHLNDLR